MLNESVNVNGVSKTAPATPGLLIIPYTYLDASKDFVKLCYSKMQLENFYSHKLTTLLSHKAL